MKKTMFALLLSLPLALSACSSATDSALLGVGALLTDACWVHTRPQVVSISAAATEIQVDYYRTDLTLAHRSFSTKEAPFLASLGTLSWPVTPPTACD